MFSDTPGNDHVDSREAGTILTAAGGFISSVAGFQSITVNATGGFDIVVLIDTPANDVLTGTFGVTTMTGGGLFRQFHGFDRIAVAAVRGGIDTAHLFDTAGNDIAENVPASRTMNLASTVTGVYLQVLQFEFVNLNFTNGGTNDRVILRDTPFNDQFLGNGATGQLTTPTEVIHTTGQHVVTLIATTGLNTLSRNALTYTLATAGPWTVV